MKSSAQKAQFPTVKLLLCVALIVAVIVAQPSCARADDAGNLIGGLVGVVLKAAQVEHARKSWAAVDTPIQQCLIDRFQIGPAELARQGISADDNRVVPYIQKCQAVVQEARLQEAREREQREAIERERKAAEQAERERKEARRKQLVEKYGAEIGNAIASGEVREGMTVAQVIESRGQPDTKIVVPPDDEMWRYNADQVIFQRGEVTAIQRK